MANTTSINAAAISLSSDVVAKLDRDAQRAAAAKARAVRQGFCTVQRLVTEFPGIVECVDRTITLLFVQAGVVDGCMYLDSEGNPTSDEETGETMNPGFMKVVCDGRKAWNSLNAVNLALTDCLTNAAWDKAARKGTLSIPGFNDGSDGAPHGNKKFTVTEAGALAALVFGTREDRAAGLYFRHMVVKDIQAQHAAYMQTPEAKAVAKAAQERRDRIEAAKERQMEAAQEAANYEQYKASLPEVTTPVIAADAGLKVAKDGTLRKGGKFVAKNKTLA
jgi:hypothetical protein